MGVGGNYPITRGCVCWRSAGQLFPVPQTIIIIIIFNIMDHYFDQPQQQGKKNQSRWSVVGGGDWILIRLKWKWLVIIILCTCPRRLILRRLQRPRVSLCGHGSHPPSFCFTSSVRCLANSLWNHNDVEEERGGRCGTGRERIQYKRFKAFCSRALQTGECNFKRMMAVKVGQR